VALGKTPEGDAIGGTYQSVLQLASDIGNPDLVYRFMQLASHNAIWTSRVGATLGFASVMSQAEEALKPHLGSLVPRLYQFQYDPSPKTADAMKSIWRSLVREPKQALDEYFEPIMRNLIDGLGRKEWRVREASCNALVDFLYGRQLSQLGPHMTDLWNMCFRVLDDIKESVRIAAFSTCKSLTNVTIKYSDPDNVDRAEGQKLVDAVLPFFLTKGLASLSEDVRKWSLQTIMKLTKRGGPLIRKHLVEIVVTLLESLTAFEHQSANYLTFHAEKYGITQDQLEQTRVNASKGSPMVCSVVLCYVFVLSVALT
jgi:proteasome component ECM29